MEIFFTNKKDHLNEFKKITAEASIEDLKNQSLKDVHEINKHCRQIFYGNFNCCC